MDTQQKKNGSGETKGGLYPRIDPDEHTKWILANHHAQEGAESGQYGTIQKGEKGAAPPHGDDEDPLIGEAEVYGRTTNLQTFMHLLKGNVGSGILAMPNAFAHAGLLVGFVGTVLLGVICNHCMHVLLRCSRYLSPKADRRALDYSEVAEYAFSHGPKAVRGFAPWMRSLVSLFHILMQMGCCCVYLLFVSDSLKQVVDGYVEESPLSVPAYLAIILPFICVYAWIRSLRRLAVASTIANVCQWVGLVIVFYFVVQDLPATVSRPMVVDIAKLPLYFGTAIFAYEGIIVVLPLENAMKTPEAFGGMTGILNVGMVIVTCMYTAVGFFGYLKYGDAIKASITLNLPPTPVSEVVRVLYAGAVFLSYALQFFVAVHILWPWFRRVAKLDDRCSPKTVGYLEIPFRTLLVLVTFVLASVVPMLDLIISLVGAVASSGLAIIFPAVLEMVTFWDSDMDRRWWWLMVLKDLVLLVLGLAGFALGSYASILAIVQKMMMIDE